MSIDWERRLPTRSGLMCGCGHYDGEHVDDTDVFTGTPCRGVCEVCECDKFEPETPLQKEARRVLTALHIGELPAPTHELIYGIEQVHECSLTKCSRQATARYKAFGHPAFAFLCEEHSSVAKKSGCMVVHP